MASAFDACRLAHIGRSADLVTDNKLDERLRDCPVLYHMTERGG